MRIATLKVHGFRGIPEEREIPFNGDVILLIGANGRGKTSVLDAVLWALTGQLSRLGERKHDVLSAYSSTGEARVELELTRGRKERVRIVRYFDGESESVKVFDSSGNSLGEGQRAILRQLWPQAQSTNGVDALNSALTRAIYLQQDMVRQFIDADEDDERYAAVSQLVGAGNVNDLQERLDRSKQRWKTAANKDKDSLHELQDELKKVNNQLSGLVDVDSPSIDQDDWHEWWQTCDDIGVDVTQIPELSDQNVSNRIDTAMKQLGVLQQKIKRNIDEARSIIEESDVQPEPDAIPNIEKLEDKVKEKSEEVKTAEKSLQEAQERAEEERRRLLDEKNEREQLATMAEIALKHIEGPCPVCQQTHDHQRTAAHLQDLIDSADVSIETSAAMDVEDANSKLHEHRKELKDLRKQLEEAQERIRDYEQWRQDRRNRIAELGIDLDEHESAVVGVRVFIGEQEELWENIRHLKESGEELALEAAKAGQESRKRELEEVREDLQGRIENLAEQVQAHNHTWDVAGSILADLRDASTDLTKLRLEETRPILQRIYSRIDPHPSFRAVDFLVDFSYRKGRLSTIIEDPVHNVKSDEPKVVLSTSQMNGLAVSIFMAFNLGFDKLPLNCAILDDPIQSLDDVNLLGLVDLLRRVKGERQLIVSTHDPRFGKLLARKLRPVQNEGRTLIQEFTGWSRSGPEIETDEVAIDDEPVRAA